MPVVTVIMAFHRVTPFLRPAVRSVLDQTFRDFELILVDDGTGAGLAPLGDDGRDPRIRLISQPVNLGIPAAHNAAVAQARGEFIALLDYDDIALPHRLQRQVAVLQAEPRLGWLGSHALRIDDQGAVLGPHFTLTSPADHFVFSAYTMPATAPTFTGRREVLERFPYRPQFPFSGDYDLLSRAAEHWEVRALPEVLLHYREHGDQTTSSGYPLQVLGGCLTRLLTARRRAGQPENLADTALELTEWLTSPPRPEVAYAHFARLCLSEGFPLLAVYHARKMLSARRDTRTLATAIGLLAGALRASPAQAAMLSRMFFTGPLRAHGLRPV